MLQAHNLIHYTDRCKRHLTGKCLASRMIYSLPSLTIFCRTRGPIRNGYSIVPPFLLATRTHRIPWHHPDPNYSDGRFHRRLLHPPRASRRRWALHLPMGSSHCNHRPCVNVTPLVPSHMGSAMLVPPSSKLVSVSYGSRRNSGQRRGGN